MDQKLYPPRCKARVKAIHISFFESSRSLDYQLVCGQTYVGKITIPRSNGRYFTESFTRQTKYSLIDSYEMISSSGSDISLQQNMPRSVSSGKFINACVYIYVCS